MDLQHVRRPEGPQDWEAQRAVILELYIAKDVELDDLMKIMEEEHFFKATKKQYKTYFTKWDLRKNIKSSEYSAMIKRRKKREEEGKDSAFRLRGALVNDSKIIRYEKKTKIGDEHEIAVAGTPENLSCFTPSPIASSPNAPSPDLRHFQSPNHLTDSIVSSSEQTHLVPSLRLFCRESPQHKVLSDRFGLARAVVSPSQDMCSVRLVVAFEDLKTGNLYCGVNGSGTLNFSVGLDGLKPSPLSTLLSYLDNWTHKFQMVCYRTWGFARFHFHFSLKPHDMLYSSSSKVSVSLTRQTDSIVAASAGAQSANFGPLERSSSQAFVYMDSSGVDECMGYVTWPPLLFTKY